MALSFGKRQTQSNPYQYHPQCPDINGEARFYGTEQIQEASGALSSDVPGTITYAGHMGTVKDFPRLLLSANLTSTIFGGSTTVQPESVRLVLCIKS